MRQAGFQYFILMLGIQIIVLTGKSNQDQIRQVRGANKAIDDINNQEVSTSFGYSIEDPHERSNHFRQEQRDVNGVVRGSYGFQNPSGAFRLVHYVADDKGFRAHITSNEHGIGRQNPASVSINRFARKPSTQDTRNFMRNPFSFPQKDYNNRMDPQSHETQEWPSRHDLFTPVKSRPRFSENLRQNLQPTKLDVFNDLRQNNPHYQMHYQYDRYSSERWNSRFGIPGEINSYIKDNDQLYHYREKNPSLRFPQKLDEILPSAGMSSFMDTVKGTPENFDEDGFESHNKAPSDGQKYGLNSRRGSNQRDSFHLSTTHSPVLNILLSRPQHKVHTSLPDCGSVSSAVLCKPPIFLSSNYIQQNSSDGSHKDILDTVTNLGNMMNSRNQNQDMQKLSEMLQRLPTEMFPPHLIPNSFPLQSDIYKSFSDSKGYPKDFQRSSDFNLPCDEKSSTLDGDELRLAPSLKNLDIYNIRSRDKTADLQSKEGTWTNAMMSAHLLNYILSRAQPIYNSHIPENRFGLESNGDRYNLLNKDKGLVFLTSKMASDKPQKLPINLLANLNLIGFVILPHQTNEDSEKDSAEDSEKLNPAEVYSQPSNLDKNNSTEFKNSENMSNNTLQTLFKGDENIEIETTPGNVLRENYHDHQKYNSNSSNTDKINLSHNEFNNNNNGNIPASGSHLKNSEFLILDDMDDFEQHNNEKTMEVNRRNNSHSTSNWRKILEDEINKDYEKTALQQEARYPDIISTLPSSFQTSDKFSDQRIYEINKPSNPLFDSRGVQIKPENVPLHLHRYIPPSGITSLPWKFTIPRPAPPRSISIPPRPPILT